MRYYLIAGEASGDLHASLLMGALKAKDPAAEFRYWGGEKMEAVAPGKVRDYRETAVMGIVEVLAKAGRIRRNLKFCKADILQFRPDAVILIDYPGFNLKIAKFVHGLRGERREERGERNEALASAALHSKEREPRFPKVYYYIAPKIWAWKEYRIKNIRRDVDELFSILPFEVDFFEKKHHYPIHYVGNPTAQEVREWRLTMPAPRAGQVGDVAARPTIALLAGSRRQEIKANLPAMIAATRHLADRYDIVIAGAPSIPRDYYEPFLKDSTVRLVFDETYPLLASATAALVTSGTATLETCMFNVPQVVCYNTQLKYLFGLLRKLLLKVKYVSLVNLIADREVVTELVADTFSVDGIRRELEKILPGGEGREAMLQGYREVHQRLGDSHAPDKAADLMIRILNA